MSTVFILEIFWKVFKMLLPARTFLQPWCSIAARLSFLSQSASSAHLLPCHPGTDAAGWQGTGAQECDLRSAVPGQKQRLLVLLECLTFWWGFGFFVWSFYVCVWFCLLILFCCFYWVSACLFWFCFLLVVVFCGFLIIFIFEWSALIWERETVTEGKKFCALYLGLSGFVYLQSLVR